MKYLLEARQGKKGRWRAYILDEDDNIVLQSNITGYATHDQAIASAKAVMRSRCRLLSWLFD